jgi:transcriptional regulator
LTEDVKIRMMRQIVPCVMQVDMIDGTWKLGQNKADAVRLAAAKQLRDSGDGSDPQQLADLMEQAT